MNTLRSHYKKPLAYYELAQFLVNYFDENTLIICIGTDKCIGDCLGPLIGTMLIEKNFPFPVFGTVSEPIHALNLDEKLSKIKKDYSNKKIIAIDACLGSQKDIGEIQIRNLPIHPGKGVGKILPEVGTLSIIGIVDSSEENELFSSKNIRLNFIFEMATVITNSLLHTYYLYSNKNK